MVPIGETTLPRNDRDNGYGNGRIFPGPRETFNWDFPVASGGIEDDIKHLEARIEYLEARPAAAPDVLTAVRIDNLVEIVGKLSERLRRIDKRSLRSRRKLAGIAGQLELQFE